LKQGVLPAPLPTVVQDRLDREAAYEKTKEEGAKWSGVMKRIKEAEHLSFPLQASDRGGTKSAGEMIASFKPANPLESAITSLLNKANLTDQAMKQHEDEALAGQDLSLEEIEARRAQLRQQRELMFRAEAKAKRVAKIKSKTFRKLARKRAEKSGISIEDLERLDPEAAEEEREKQERQRAKERATLRHGAGGKFGRETAGGTTFGLEDRRKAREDMLDVRERLQRKIAGRGDGESDDDEDEDEESDEDEDDEDIKAAAFNQLARLDGKDSSGEHQGKKGLMQMKFMQKAQDREMRKVAEQEQALREEIRLFGQEDGEGSGEEEDDEDEEGPQMMKLGEGRMVFSGPAKVGAVFPRHHLVPLCSPRRHLLNLVISLLSISTIANNPIP
jgi:U3 small nucleolar RNA-associated protein 14